MPMLCAFPIQTVRKYWNHRLYYGIQQSAPHFHPLFLNYQEENSLFYWISRRLLVNLSSIWNRSSQWRWLQHCCPLVPAEQDVSRLIPFLVLQANTADWMSSPSPDDPEKLAAILKLMEWNLILLYNCFFLFCLWIPPKRYICTPIFELFIGMVSLFATQAHR